MKKILGLAIAFTIIVPAILYADINLSSHTDKVKKATEEYYAQQNIQDLFKNVDAVAIENTIDDKDGQLSKAGISIEILNNAELESLKKQLSLRVKRPIRVSFLNKPYNYNTSNTLIMAVHWDTKKMSHPQGSYGYRSVLTTKRKINGAIKEVRQTLPGGTEIYYSVIPATKDELQKEIEMQSLSTSSSLVDGIEHFN